MGLWDIHCATLRDGRTFDCDDLPASMNLSPELASPIGSRTASAAACSTVVSCLADTNLDPGFMAGARPDVDTVAGVRDAVPDDVPIPLDRGATKENRRLPAPSRASRRRCCAGGGGFEVERGAPDEARGSSRQHAADRFWG